MKRYLLFVFDLYYPGGGWNDLEGDFDTFEAAKQHIIKLWKEGKRFDVYQIVDTATGKVYGYGEENVEEWLGIKPEKPKERFIIPRAPPTTPVVIARAPSVLAPTPLQLKVREEFAKRMRERKGQG